MASTSFAVPLRPRIAFSGPWASAALEIESLSFPVPLFCVISLTSPFWRIFSPPHGPLLACSSTAPLSPPSVARRVRPGCPCFFDRVVIPFTFFLDQALFFDSSFFILPEGFPFGSLVGSGTLFYTPFDSLLSPLSPPPPSVHEILLFSYLFCCFEFWLSYLESSFNSLYFY